MARESETDYAFFAVTANAEIPWSGDSGVSPFKSSGKMKAGDGVRVECGEDEGLPMG